MWALLARGGSTLARWGVGLFAADTIVRGSTEEGLISNVADALSDNVAQPILEGMAEAGVDAEQHASGQNLISWGNWVASIPFLGQSQVGQMIAQFFRNWGEQYQNADSENDGSAIPDTADQAAPAAAGIAMSAFNGAALGATVGMVVPLSVPFTTAIGAGVGAGYGVLDQATDGWLTSTFNSAMQAVGLQAAPPTPSPSFAPVPVTP